MSNNMDSTTLIVGAATMIGGILIGKKLVSGVVYGAGFALGCMMVYNYKDNLSDYTTQITNFPIFGTISKNTYEIYDSASKYITAIISKK